MGWAVGLSSCLLVGVIWIRRWSISEVHTCVPPSLELCGTKEGGLGVPGLLVVGASRRGFAQAPSWASAGADVCYV